MESMLQPGIFRHPRPKKSVLPPPSKKRKLNYKVEEISFDHGAREDYLTGFHKRKVQRTKQAQVEAEKKAREERIVMRKQLREERKQELEDHVAAVNEALRAVISGSDSEEDEDWNGIEEEDPVPDLVDHEEEYVDEDRYTTVTIEAVDVSKEGLNRVKDLDEEIEDNPKPKPTSIIDKDEGKKKKWPKKERKKKFRYESKIERKITRAKQKAGKKARADVRKGDS